MKKLFFIAVLAVTGTAGCYYDNVEELNLGSGLFDNCDTVSTISYSTHIVPTMQNFCYSCHSGSSPSSGYRLDTHADLQLRALDPNNVLLGNINHAAGFNPMPPTFKMDECRIRQFELWVAAGAPNN
jgi:hypothetical protein